MPSYWTTSAIEEILKGMHAFEANAANPVTAAGTFKIALYTDAATNITVATSLYATTNEVPTGNGYVRPGKAVVPRIVPYTRNAKAGRALTFDDIEFTGSPTFSWKKALLYNEFTASVRRAVAVFELTAAVTATGATYRVGPNTTAGMEPLWIAPV